ncbi:MOSC N-terminal beta barrel domain-containing protein [Sphaerisporangium sp. NPDC088356]|uniref:MOSC domain-containing protein n=1 Tax=Sphaerisporangium sp. NPDC088356 TaxID=3154871 RepID=UPI003414D17D
MHLTNIRIYPVKSMGGVGLNAATVDLWGLDGDRRWAVVAADGEVYTARDLPRMLSVTAAPAPGGAVTLTAPGLPPIELSPPVDGTPTPVRLSRLDTAMAASEEAHRWMSRALGLPARLLWLEDPLRRTVGRSHGGRPGDTMVFQDDGPLLLASRSSLRRLDDWIAEGAVERGEEIPEPLSVLRFRPNVVIEGAEPFAEDTWTRVRIGEVEFRVGEHCDRCVLTTVDPVTAVKGKEPTRTLSQHRNWDGKTWFGIRLIPDGRGEIRVGDAVTAAL